MFINLMQKSPRFRRFFHRTWYRYLARLLDSEMITFMNYGFAGGESIELEPRDFDDRNCIQLYHHVLQPITVADKTVLEVSSGRGGGASFVMRYLKPQALLGVDFVDRAP